MDEDLASKLVRVLAYWLSLLGRAITVSVKVWGSLFVANLVLNVIAYGVTRIRTAEAEFSGFFVPNLLTSLGITLLALVVIRVLVLAAEENHQIRIEANKLTWNDVEVSLEQLPPLSPHDFVIRVSNQKPFALGNARIEVLHVQVNKTPLGGGERILPYGLAAIEERSQLWEAVTIPAFSSRDFALFDTTGGGDSVGYVTPSNFGIAVLADQDHVIEIRPSAMVDGCPLPQKSLQLVASNSGRIFHAEFT